MLLTQGAPDPRTQPELYQRWTEEVFKPRGEYGIWLESPIAGTPNYDFQQTGTGLIWQTKPNTEITATAPGQVIYAGPTADQGYIAIVQHDFGQTIYNNLAGVAVFPGQNSPPATWWACPRRASPLASGWLVMRPATRIPTPYLPSLGERGPSGWALTDIPGVTAPKGAVPGRHGLPHAGRPASQRHARRHRPAPAVRQILRRPGRLDHHRRRQRPAPSRAEPQRPPDAGAGRAAAQPAPSRQP